MYIDLAAQVLLSNVWHGAFAWETIGHFVMLVALYLLTVHAMHGGTGRAAHNIKGVLSLHFKCARGAVRQGHKAALARKLAERQADARAKQEQLPATEQACNHPDTSGSLHDTTACLDRATERGQSSALLQ